MYAPSVSPCSVFWKLHSACPVARLMAYTRFVPL
jgi:hypothetical protein